MSNNIRSALNFLASAGPLANTTVKNADADEIMLQTGGSIMSRGCLYNIKSQSVSPGVCRLTLERANQMSALMRSQLCCPDLKEDEDCPACGATPEHGVCQAINNGPKPYSLVKLVLIDKRTGKIVAETS